MAVATTKRKSSQANMPATRVYSYSREATAAKLEPEYNKQHPAASTRIAKPRVEARKRAKAERQLGKKLLMITAIGVAAASMLMILFRYSIIADEYSVVNELKSSITESERNITSLNVQLNSAMDLVSARETAQAAGLDYPTADQIVRIDGSDSLSSGGDALD